MGNHKPPSLNSVIAYNSIIRACDLLIPLAAIPFLFRQLSAEGYGIVVWLQTLAVWISICIDFGFSLTGVRLAAKHQHDKFALSKIFWEIQTSKIIISIITFALLPLLFIVLPPPSSIKEALIFSAVHSIGFSLLPIWFFQALEKSKQLAIVSIICRGASLAFLFVYIKGPQDYLLASIILAAWSIPAAAWANVTLLRNSTIVLRPISWRGISDVTAEAVHPFIASASSGIYRSSGSIILGSTLSASSAAVYGTCEKIVRATQTLTIPITQAVYVRLNQLQVSDPKTASKLRRKSSTYLILATTILCMLIAFFADLIFSTISGTSIKAAEECLMILAFAPIFGVINNFVGIQTLVVNGHQRAYSAAVVAVSIASLISMPMLISELKLTGASFVFTLSEVFLSIILISCAYKYRNQIHE